RSFQCRASNLKKHLARTATAAKYDETRMELSGVLFFAHEKTLTLVATDAYRLAESSLTLEEPATEDIRAIVPLKTVQELLRNLPDDPESIVQLFLSDTQITCVVDTIELVSKLIEGNYPDYTQIIPSSFSTRAVVDRSEWMRTVKASSIFSRAGLNDVTLQFETGESDKGTLTVSSANTTVGETAMKLDIACSGSSVSMSLNFRYLLDGLSNMTTAQVSVGAIDSNSPCIIKPVGEEDYQYMVMPIRE
ncbi:MAG: DNA polymerase III subunit beta, partial [bacterium]|nr:DNA polymerase III subunit beta [bacterium]